MSIYYSGEDEKRKKQKEELTPKKDTSGNTYLKRTYDSSDLDKHQTAETVEAVDSKDAGSGKGLKQKIWTRKSLNETNGYHLLVTLERNRLRFQSFLVNTLIRFLDSKYTFYINGLAWSKENKEYQTTNL